MKQKGPLVRLVFAFDISVTNKGPKPVYDFHFQWNPPSPNVTSSANGKAMQVHSVCVAVGKLCTDEV